MLRIVLIFIFIFQLNSFAFSKDIPVIVISPGKTPQSINTVGSSVEVIDGEKHKTFYGMSSDTAMNKYHGGVAKYRSSEGKTVRIKHRGRLSDTIESILGGLRSTCTYIGAKKLKYMPKCATFVRVNQQSNEIFGRNT